VSVGSTYDLRAKRFISVSQHSIRFPQSAASSRSLHPPPRPLQNIRPASNTRLSQQRRPNSSPFSSSPITRSGLNSPNTSILNGQTCVDNPSSGTGRPAWPETTQWPSGHSQPFLRFPGSILYAPAEVGGRNGDFPSSLPDHSLSRFLSPVDPHRRWTRWSGRYVGPQPSLSSDSCLELTSLYPRRDSMPLLPRLLRNFSFSIPRRTALHHHFPFRPQPPLGSTRGP